MTSGLPTKMGADDFIVRFGEDAFRRLVNQAMQPPPPPRPLGDYRDELARVRVESVGNPGVYLDTSPTGSGKTTADIPAVAAAETSLTVLPTHKHCGDLQEAYTQYGLNAEAYPQLNKNTCQNLDEATRAIDAGLSASTAVCPTCACAYQCEYRSLLEAAEGAAHRIATHQRARMGFVAIAEGRRIIMVHENPVNLLRPLEEIADGLVQVGEVARAAKDSARDGNDMDLYQFFWRMEDKSLWLSEQLLQANDTTPLSIPSPIGTPPLLTCDCTLRCNRSGCIQPPGQCGSSKRWQQVNSRKSSCGWTAFSLPVGSPSSRSLLSPYGKRNFPKASQYGFPTQQATRQKSSP